MKVAHKTYSNQRQFHLSLNFYFFGSAFTLDWLRLNWIKIFHYLSNQLKGTPKFENDHRKIDKNKESGAVFNNFDFQPDELLSSTHNNTVFGAISNSSAWKWRSLFDPPRISVSCRIRSRQIWTFFYNVMSFEHPHYDISSSAPNKEYMEKVYKIVTGGFKELPIARKMLKMYEIRQRGEWEEPDWVYDAWQLSNNSRRKWFPHKFFTKIYPDWEEKKNQVFEEEKRVKFSLEDQSSLHSTVDIDDKNNCRSSSSKSENKHIMLDTSDQDLSSSYRDTQDSDIEDDSSTNGSASEQKLFISTDESDSE